MTSCAVERCQPWFYLRLEAYSFFWLSEGAYSLSRDSWCSKHTLRLTRLWRLTLEPKRQKNRKAITRNESSNGRSLTQRLSCLLFQMFCVETNSFLPNEQSGGRDLTRQDEARQIRLHASGDAGLVKVLERSHDRGGSRRCTLEDIIQIVIMV